MNKQSSGSNIPPKKHTAHAQSHKIPIILATPLLMAGATLGLSLILSYATRPFLPPCQSPFGCGNIATQLLATFAVAALLSVVIGIITLRSIVRLRWIAAITAPLVGYFCMFSFGGVAMAVYGENFLGHPIYLTLLSFYIPFVITAILLDLLKNWLAYAVAAALLVGTFFFTAPLLAGIAQSVWVSHGITRAKNIATVYLPANVPKGYSLSEVTTFKTTYTLAYQTHSRFNPYDRYDASDKSFTITADRFEAYDPPKVCATYYPHTASEPDALLACKKVADTATCPLYKHFSEAMSRTDYYCKVGSLRFTLTGSISDTDATKILGSMKVKP